MAWWCHETADKYWFRWGSGRSKPLFELILTCSQWTLCGTVENYDENAIILIEKIAFISVVINIDDHFVQVSLCWITIRVLFAAEIDIHKYVKHMLTQDMLTWNKLCLAIHIIFIDQMGWCSRNQHMFILPQVPEHSLLHAKCIHEKHLTMLFAKCRHFASMS